VKRCFGGREREREREGESFLYGLSMGKLAWS